ncbi:hypothetical protein BKA70DRAFT_1125845 [Coprinopsis sp. MPI-PUGE-AT-0042]|nr:hypothetical protein BKA70DRAFT_1125845 [Coprinopsis sp. MPI-PUGE-AT-0042]
MHQSHNIPWGVFAEHLKFAAHQPAFPQRPPQLISRGKLGEGKALNHFLAKFVSTLEDFSQTERKKYRPSSEFTFPSSGNIFSDNLKAKHSMNLNDSNQKFEDWIARKFSPGEGSPLRYYWGDSSLVDVVKVLIAENDMDTLLMLANHPEIPLHTFFQYNPWSHEVNGLFNVMETAVSSYLFFNIAYTTGDLDNGNWRRIDWYESIRMRLPAPDWDWPTEKITHGQFCSCSKMAIGDTEGPADFRPDYSALHEDLKRDFELMYRYDMFLREMGMDSPWKRESVRIIATRVRGLNICVKDGERPDWDIPSLFC